ncbi:uncharacterized protein yc1106_02485 [Curvularia clavata]|uniref:Uncharacterized protein n=1 Tax=Curvularia clavata TaxID=95742 RepID=A0A9Q8Z3F7_CURCL|nr:uncharacterized protein yc1106_02485 [Curvularia clavata]
MDEDENIDIAAAMGFSSFGGTKKRKFDHTNSPKAATGASGANSTQLGVRTKKIASSEANEHEDSDANLVDQAKNAQDNGSMKTQAPGSGLASFLARGQTLAETPLGTGNTFDASASRDQNMTEMVSFGGSPISRAELNALRNGVQNEHGDTAYFQPSFIEDPWANLKNSSSG